MKHLRTSLLAIAVLALATPALRAGDATKDAMKKFHKGEETIAKKTGAGEASPGDVSALLAGYEAMLKDNPPKGTRGSWETKVGTLIEGVKKIQGGGSPGTFKAAVQCKACHDVHKGK